MRRRGVVAAVALSGLLLLSACSSTTEKVTSALDSAASASATAATALRLFDSGLALRPFTDTVLGDTLTELDTASTDLTEAGPIGDPAAASARDRALDAIEAATDAVLAARETVAAGRDAAPDLAAVESATDRLHALSEAP